tara:strand:+ start:5751 stop:6275 length:525 start_codon:yes stop_codon:yes gene_type:complete
MLFEAEDPQQTYLDNTYTPIGNTKDFIRGRWLLISGQYYINNHVSDITNVTDHFTEGDTSSLNIEGAAYNFEEIIRGKTTWTFYPKNRDINQFWLNGDSIHPLWLTSFGDTVFNVNEYPIPINFQQLGGSTRPIILVGAENNTMTIVVQESEVNYQGWNVRYWSRLTFRKVASW